MLKKNKKSPSKVKLILIFVAIFLVVICGYLYYGTQNQKNISTSGWKEFNDTQHHFSYKYPPEFVQTKDYGTLYASQFTLTSNDFVDFNSPIGERTSVIVQYSDGGYFFSSIQNLAELKKFLLDNKNSKEFDHYELVKIEDVLVGGKPALFVVKKPKNSSLRFYNYRSYYSIRAYVRIDKDNSLVIESSIRNTPYNENFYKAFFSTFKFY